MGYPERLLSDGEAIERQFRPHWSAILREGLIVLGGIGLAVVLVIFDAPPWTDAEFQTEKAKLLGGGA